MTLHIAVHLILYSLCTWVVFMTVLMFFVDGGPWAGRGKGKKRP